MKVYTNKFNDSFYIPVTNTSCKEDLSYQVSIDDTYGILSVENTVGPGPRNNIYITVPKVPSIRISQGTLYAKRGESAGVYGGAYYLEVTSATSMFNAYDEGTPFYLFYLDGTYTQIEVVFNGYDGTSPLFLIDESSLQRILGSAALPVPGSPVLLNQTYFMSKDMEVRNFLKVDTLVSRKGRQVASISLRALGAVPQREVYEFIIDPTDSPVEQIEQPPIGIKETETSQLARSFVPVSSVVTLQVNSEGELYMDKIHSGSTSSQKGYRRRCTNLGFEKDLARFCASIPKTSLYSFSDEDLTISSTNLSDQYFTDVNCGVSINRETEEGFRFFAPLWLKDRVPSYFAIFRKSATSKSSDLLEGASLVKLIDINKTELGPYLKNLMQSERFLMPPMEVAIDRGYSVKWNGVSVDTGYWMSHTEFMGIDIQEGLSDFEFNRMLSGGFSRGSIVCPQLLNIEFLFDDVDAKLYDVNQYFGMYCDDVSMSRFIPNIDSTTTMFLQNQTRPSSNMDPNYSVVSNVEGVKLVVDLNENPDRSFVVTDPSTVVVNSTKVSSRYSIAPLPTTASSRLFKVSFTSDVDITALFSPGTRVRLEDANRTFISYITVKGSTYQSNEKSIQVTFDETDTFSGMGVGLWLNIFDFNPDPSPSIKGRIRFDSVDVSKARCVVVSTEDVLGTPVQQWIDSVVDQGSAFRDSLVVFDKSSSAYAILLASSVVHSDDYIKVFVDVIESNGSVVEGDQAFVNVSEYDVDGAIPGPKVINSPTRKFILRSKEDAYSIKRFSFSNYKNQVVGIIDLDSTTFNLGSIIGTSASSSIPVIQRKDPYHGVGLRFPLYDTETMRYGDAITVEQIIGSSKRTWSVVRSSQSGPQVTRSSGATTEAQIAIGTFSSDAVCTKFEVPPDVFPSRMDTFVLTNPSSPGPDIPLYFVQAQQQENGNYLLVFSNKNLPQGYQSLRISTPEAQVTYVDFSSDSSLETAVSVAFQRFSDCPMKAAVSNGTLYLYTADGADGISVGLYLSYGTIVQMQINGSLLKPVGVLTDATQYLSDYYIYPIEKTVGTEVYSIEDSFASRIEGGTKILSKSGSPSTAMEWNNMSYSIPDIRSIVEEGEQRSIIRFDAAHAPSLLNDRLQLIVSNDVSLSLLSFYDFIDLDFFDEIPFRVENISTDEEQTIANEGAIFSRRSTDASTKQKTIVLSVDIAENMYSNWRGWDPSKDTNFSAYKGGTIFGTPSPVGDFPTSWNPSYGFKIQYLNRSNEWVDLQLSYPTASMKATVVQRSFVNTLRDPMWDIVFGDVDLSSSTGTFEVPQSIYQTVLSYIQDPMAFGVPQGSTVENEKLRGAAELKRLVSYCFTELAGPNVNPDSSRGTYTYGITLSIDEDHRNYRYVSTFPDGTYTVKELMIGGELAGVPKENVISNFSTSLESEDGKTKMTVGRWKRRNSSNVDAMPYLINVDPLLLPYDMFVDGTDPDASKLGFSLDWYLISGWPKFNGQINVESNYQYIGKRLDLDMLKSVQYDYFTDYFTVGSGEEVFSDGSKRGKKFLWSTIEESNGSYTTTFKGLPLVFSSPKINLSGARFAAVLQVEKDLGVPMKTTLVFNRQWNTLTLFVQACIDSYFIDGSLSLSQLYDLRMNVANTDSSVLYGPMMIHGSDLLSFNRVDRAYNEEEARIISTPVQSQDYYEFNQYRYENVVRMKYDTQSKDIELFGVKYVPKVDYVVSGTIFYGTSMQTDVNMVIPKSRLRGVFDPSSGTTKSYIDGLYGDNFFAVFADIDGMPSSTFATFVGENTISISGSLGQIGSTSITVNGETTSIYNARVYAIGDYPVYGDIVQDLSAYSIISKMQTLSFDDILVSQDYPVSSTSISMSYAKPQVIRPLVTKNASIDADGNVRIEKRSNETNIFRLDGGFEPSYKRILSFAASEDPSITKQLLNSLRGYNTQIIGIQSTTAWYRRISNQGVNMGTLNINGTLTKIPYAIGKRTIDPAINTWGDGFYSMAEGPFVDVPVMGILDPKDQRFFLSSKSMSVPSFVRTSSYSFIDSSIGIDTQNAAVSYIAGPSMLSIQIDLAAVISECLFNSGVFSFFFNVWDELGTNVSPQDISKEYIERNLLERYSIKSIDVYQRPFAITEIVSVPGSPEDEGFTQVDTIGIAEQRFFDFSIPIDFSKQVVLAFNIKRR